MQIKSGIDHPAQWAILNYGAKASFISTDNMFRFFDVSEQGITIDNVKSNAFQYKEDTQSLYASLQKDWIDKWEFKVGLRLENTQTTGMSIASNQSIGVFVITVQPDLFIPATAHLRYTTYRDVHSPQRAYRSFEQHTLSKYAYDESTYTALTQSIPTGQWQLYPIQGGGQWH
ncbi:hypothetical protein FQR65_LT15614 [Abscondita terminalis]|nr:hypothetical protein FQR65_LT15614 [Abscondita terminalis]